MENNYKEIKYNGEMIKIHQYIAESNNQFEERLKYIKSAENNNLPSKEAIRLSKIWYSYTYKKCKYNKDTYYLMSSIMK